MATSPVTTRLLQPPANAPPVGPDGQFTQAWANYNANVADVLRQLVQGSQAGTDLGGVTDGSDAAAGDIGEYLSASGSSGVAGATVVATLPLTAGDWSVEGNVAFTLTGSGAWQCLASVSLSSGGIGPVFQNVALPAGFTTCALGTGGAVRLSLSAGATAYLMAQGGFTGSLSASGAIWARRAR